MGNTTSGRSGSGMRSSVVMAVFMVGVALISVAAAGIYDMISTRDTLNGVVEAQLTDVAASSIDSLADRFAAIESGAAVIAADPSVARALDELSMAYREFPATTPEQKAALAEGYGSEFADAASSADDPPPEELIPTSGAAQYLQYWYITQNPDEDRAALDKADDGSTYSDRHAFHHPMLRAMANAAALGDLLLVDTDGVVVYSVDKNIDVGTSLVTGPHKDSVLAEAAIEAADDLGVGQAAVTDLAFYAPALYAPTLFVASPVSNDGELLGYLLLEVPGEQLTAFATNGLDWEGIGLGDTGEVYLVGPDLTLRSDSRLWLEDPEAYLATAREDEPGVADTVETRRTTVLIQPVDTQAVNEALSLGSFAGVTENYLGIQTATVAESISVGDSFWVLVGDLATEEAYSSLHEYLRVLLIIALILIPLVVIFAWVASRRMVRPVGDLVATAQEVGAGSTDVVAPDFGTDEFGDVAQRLNEVIHAMQTQEAELEAADAETSELLLATMPPELARRILQGDRDVAHEVRTATVVVAIVDDPQVVDPVGQDSLADRAVEVSAHLNALAQAHGAEKLQSSSKEYLFAVGLDSEEAEANEALAFALAVRAGIAEIAASSGVPITGRVGLAAGDVVEGIVGVQRLAFTVWGAPVSLATDLSLAAQPGEVLVDATVAGRLEEQWSLEPLDQLVSLSGVRLHGWRVTNDAPASVG